MIKVDIQMEVLDYHNEEAYKALRTNLKFCGSDKKVIGITSCQPSEGKSTVSLNLAKSLADSGEKVVLVECDLRKPVLIGRTNVSGGDIKGLTYFLSQQASLNDVICSTNIDNLQIIYAGPIAPNPAELLGSKYFKAGIEALRKVFDYIIIDTPPLGAVIDSAIISQNCDGMAIVLESGKDSYRFVRDVKEQLDKAGVPILGIILNKVEISKTAYYGRYGKYGKYGKYGSYGAYGRYGYNVKKEEK